MTEHFTTNEDVVDLRVDDLEGTFEPSPQVIEPFPGDLPGAVRWLTQRGFALFPVKLTTVVKGGKVKLDKKPLGCWSAISSKEADYVMELLRSRQGAPWNVKEGLALGMDCGESDAFILDVDVRNGAPGMESLAVLEAKYGKLPLTWVSRTPSGGLHYWFRGHGRNSASSKELGAGLDTRGDGGLIVIPPSIADDGTTYTWVNAPDQVALADAPEWLIELTRKQEQPQNSSEGGCVGGFAPGIDFDEEIFEGSRNNDLFKRACRLRAEGWEKDGLFAAIWEVNQRKCHP